MLQMTLLENALDFLEYAFDSIFESEVTPKTFKYAVLHLNSGVELLLKQRLLDEDWSLLFSKSAKANIEKFKSGNFHSVDMDNAIERLAGKCLISIKEQHKVALKALKGERNKIEHYQFNLNENEVSTKSVAIGVWNFVFEFVNSNITLNEPNLKKQFDQIAQRLLGYEEFVEHRLEEIESNLTDFIAQDIVLLECTQCLQKTVPMQENEDRQCLFCKTNFEATEFLEQWLDRFDSNHTYDSLKDGTVLLTDGIHECPNCGANGLHYFKGYYKLE